MLQLKKGTPPAVCKGYDPHLGATKTGTEASGFWLKWVDRTKTAPYTRPAFVSFARKREKEAFHHFTGFC
jgi:hypothetical protein